jgi:acetyl esterase
MMSQATLDPDIAAFVRTMARAWADYPPFMAMPLDEARAAAETIRAPWRAGGPEMARTAEHVAPTATGPVRVRLYDPGLTTPAPVLIYLHGGGFTLFSLDTHDRLMREYAAAGGFLVAGVDYPLSPEARYPVALDQIVAVIDWLAGPAAADLGADPARIAIGGDSAGANLSMAAALRLRDRGDGHVLKGLLLNYGAFGAPCSDASEAAFGGPTALLNRAEVDYYFANYFGAADARADDPYARPCVADLTGLPPAFLVIPDRDVLAEQSRDMLALLTAAGVPAEAREYAGATHSFLEAMSISALARRAIADGAGWVRDRLAD